MVGALLYSLLRVPLDLLVTRNLSWKLEDEGVRLGAVIHDRDKKFAPAADAVIRSEGARVILTPLRAPSANAHAERWIGSCRGNVWTGRWS